MAQARRWCGTLNCEDSSLNFGELVKKISETDGVEYIIAQVERGHETGRLHLQFYLQLSRSQRLNWLKAKISEQAHFEKARGSVEENRKYCMKEDTRVEGPWEYGAYAKQGQTRGLEQIAEMIKGGANLKEIADEFPAAFIRHHRGLEAYKRVQAEGDGCRNFGPDGPEVWVFWGPTGSGKSRRAREMWPDAYEKMTNGQWWDGYAGEETVIFDDFKGSSMKLHDLQLVLDWGRRVQVEVKGGSVALRATRFVFTSNRHPSEWYSAEADPDGTIMRRIREFCADKGRLLRFPEEPPQLEWDILPV